MNNIYGQPNNYYDRYEDSYTRPRQKSQSRRHEDNEHCEHHEDHHEDNEHCERHEDNNHCEHHEDHHEEHHEEHYERCEQLGGTVLRIDIPAGAEINVLNLVELASPSGICLILRLPFLGGECK
jgi:hypothetical protein